MPITQDSDVWRSASHRLMASHLTGPFSAGARERVVPVDSAGRLSVTTATREPLVVVAPLASLDATSWTLTAELDPDGSATALTPLEYSAYTESGAFLPLYRPATDAGTATANPFVIQLTLTQRTADGSQSVVPTTELASRVEVRLIEGILGRMVYVLGAEKLRLRRQARELCAMRRLDRARDNVLDRAGAEVGVPRFEDHIGFSSGEITTEIRSEPDTEYRRRLRIYRRMLMPNHRRILQLLNGPGSASDPNQGPLGAMGLQERFRLVEEDNAFSFAVHLVETGGGTLRNGFLDYVRKVHLVLPADTAANGQIHDERYLPSSLRTRIGELRSRLRSTFQFDATAAIAPMLASALDRVGRCRAALGVALPWQVTRAQDSAGGSRYELGLGVDVTPRPTVELDGMRARLLDPGRPPDADQEIEGILRSLVPRLASEDPEGRWLLEGCGLRTVHRIDSNRIYLSHLPTFGMAITGPAQGNPGQPIALEARHHAPGDPGKNVVLVSGLNAALADWQAQGGAAWSSLSDAQAQTRWDAAGALPASEPGLGIFRAAGLPAIEDPAPIVQRLKLLPGELLETVQLAVPHAQRIVSGQASAVDELRRLIELLRRQGLTSVIPLIVGATEVLLVVAVIGLPEAGINLSERRATGFRWYVVPLEGPKAQIKALGSRTTLVANGEGLSAVVAIGYARRGATDPYEFRVELPEHARLNLLQYEFLMNVLQHAHPVGVEVNTFSIRQRHVDLDEDGTAEPLPPSTFRTFRQFRRTRSRGEAGVRIDEA